LGESENSVECIQGDFDKTKRR